MAIIKSKTPRWRKNTDIFVAEIFMSASELNPVPEKCLVYFGENLSGIVSIEDFKKYRNNSPDSRVFFRSGLIHIVPGYTLKEK